MKPVSHFHLGSLRTETYIVVISLPSCVPSVCVSRISGQSPLKRPVWSHTVCILFFWCTMCTKQRLDSAISVSINVVITLFYWHAFWCILTRTLVTDMSIYNYLLLKCRDVNMADCGTSPMQGLQCCGTSAFPLLASWTQLSSLLCFSSGSLFTVAVSAFLVWLYCSAYLHQRPGFDDLSKNKSLQYSFGQYETSGGLCGWKCKKTNKPHFQSYFPE